MSIMQACADVAAAIGRARSLFGDASAPEAPSGATDIDLAAQTAVAARARTVGLSGHGIDSYQSVVDRSVGLLDTAAGSDRALAAHMKTAAAVTQAGAARLDHIAAQNQEISRAAPGATTPADERIILAALRSQLAQTSQVVQSTQQQAAELAGHIRSLQYPKDTPQTGGPDDTIIGDTEPKRYGVQLVDNDRPLDTPTPPVPSTEDLERGLAGRVAEGAIIGGIAGVPEGGVGAVPGAIIGGGLAGIEWFIEQTQK